MTGINYTMRQMLDSAILGARMRNSPNVMLLAHSTVKAYLKAQKPSLHMLYNAGWKAGYTVNGIRP